MISSPFKPKPEVGRAVQRVPAFSLLSDLPSRPKQFIANLRVALGPARRSLAYEQNLDGVSPRSLAFSVCMHTCLLAAILILPHAHRDVPVLIEDKLPQAALIYYRTESLPSMQDQGGSASGASGAAGGRSAFHPKQTIHVVRSVEINPTVVDAPKLVLPQGPINAANLLAFSSPSANAPLLSAPVELAQMKSKIRKMDRTVEATAADAPHFHLSSQQKNIRDLSGLMTNTAETSRVTLAPRPRPTLPRQVGAETASVGMPELQRAELKTVPPPEDESARPIGTPATATRQEVVISAKPGDVIGIPADGKADAVALSPKGGAQPGASNEGRGNSIAKGSAGSGSSSAGERPGSGSNGAKLGSNPSTTTGISPSPGASGAGNGHTSAIPGVEVRGGVVSLDSFGAKGPQANPARTRERRSAPITVVATSRSGGGLAAYGAFKNRIVYTVYIDTGAGQAVLQFASRDSAADPSVNLTAPDPLYTETPRTQANPGVVFSCVLDESGHLQNLRVISGSSPDPALMEAVRRWVFYPALSENRPVAVDAMIGIGIGVE